MLEGAGADGVLRVIADRYDAEVINRRQSVRQRRERGLGRNPERMAVDDLHIVEIDWLQASGPLQRVLRIANATEGESDVLRLERFAVVEGDALADLDDPLRGSRIRLEGFREHVDDL